MSELSVSELKDTLEVYFGWHVEHDYSPEIPDEVRELPIGCALYCNGEPLALVANNGDVQILNESQWNMIHAAYGE